MRASSPPPEEDVQGLLEGLCRVLSSPGRNAAARLQALHHINTLSSHSDATRNSVTSHALVPLTTALADADVNVHCEAASAIGNLVHGSPARAARLIEAGVVGLLMNLLRERHPLTLTRASLALGALLRASVACRQQLEVYGRETLLPLMLSHNQQVCDGAEYAILGLYGGGDDPAAHAAAHTDPPALVFARDAEAAAALGLEQLATARLRRPRVLTMGVDTSLSPALAAALFEACWCARPRRHAATPPRRPYRDAT